MSDPMKWKPEFRNRYECREAELRSLYEQLYPGQKEGFAYLIQRMYQNYVERPVPLRKIDRKRRKIPAGTKAMIFWV